MAASVYADTADNGTTAIQSDPVSKAAAAVLEGTDNAVTLQPLEKGTAEAATAAKGESGLMGTIYPQNWNGIKTKDDVIVYETPASELFSVYSYHIVIRSACTLGVVYSALGDVSIGMHNSAGKIIFADGTDDLDDGVKAKYYKFDASGTVTLDVTLFAPNTGKNAAAFSVLEASSASKVIPRGKEYIHGNTSSNNSAFKVKAPSNGYFKVALADGTKTKFTVKAKTKGFSDYHYFTSNDNTCWIGVKKGTYTFKVDTYTPLYAVKVSFKKVKESPYGSKRSKAKKIKKNKIQKGLMITGKQKVHWYKFKNPKNQKVKLIVRSKLTDTGKYGGIKVTVYSKNDQTAHTIYSGNRSETIKLYNYSNGEKLAKGTYYIKFAPYNKGTGYYTLKWK